MHDRTPDWINNYQPKNPSERKLLINFRELFANDIDSQNYQRALSAIYNILVSKKLLILSDSNNINIDYGKATEKNLNWLRRRLIVIHPRLIIFLENYCQNYSPGENTKSLDRLVNKLHFHLQKLAEGEQANSRSNYISHYLEKILTFHSTSHDTDTEFLEQINPLITRWRRIQFFDPNQLPETVRPQEGFYIQQGLSLWIKNNMRWRIKDLYRRSNQQKSKTITDLNENRSYNYNPNNNPNQPNHTPENKIPGLLSKYLIEDPHGYLASRIINKDYPRCTYKILAEHLIHNISSGNALGFSHGVITKIAEDFQIPYQTLASQISRNFLPFVASLTLQLGFSSETIKDAIKADNIPIFQEKDEQKSKYLKDIKKIIKKLEIHNAQTLAIQLLPMFISPQEIADTITHYLNTNDNYNFYNYRNYNLNISTNIDTSNPSYKVFLKISEELNYQIHRQINQEALTNRLTVYDIQSIWEQAVINQINQEIYNNHKIIVKFEITDNFWKTKCLKYLGKLVMILRDNQQNQSIITNKINN